MVPPLPPGYRIRPACASDRWALLRIRQVFHRRGRWQRIWQSLGWLIPLILFELICLMAIGVLIFLLVALQGDMVLPLTIVVGFLIVAEVGVVAQSLAPLFLPRDWSRIWVVENSQHLVGYAAMVRDPEFSYLSMVFVAPAYRSQGIGSALVRQVIQTEKKPLYLWCKSDLTGFYARFGFSRVLQRRELPKRMRPQVPWVPLSNYLVLTETTDAGVEATPGNGQQMDFWANCQFRPAQPGDKPALRRLILASTDLFLPFGVQPERVGSGLGLVIVCLPLVILFQELGLQGSSLLISLLVKLGIGFLVGIPIGTLLGLIGAIVLGPNQWSQFWVVEFEQKLIGYGRLSRYQRYSVLRYLYIEPMYRHVGTGDRFLQQIIPTIRKPIYVAVRQNQVKPFTRLGFVPVPPHTLPQPFRLGAHLNRWLGGITLVLW